MPARLDPCTDWQIPRQTFHRHLVPLGGNVLLCLALRGQTGRVRFKAAAETCHNTNPDRPNKHCKIARGGEGRRPEFRHLVEDFCLHNSTSWLRGFIAMASGGYSIQSLLQNDAGTKPKEDEPRQKPPKSLDKKPDIQLPPNPLAVMMLQERLFNQRKSLI